MDYLERKGFLGRLKTLSKPTGKPLWGTAVRTILLITLAGILASYLGFGERVGAVISVTLFACIIVDQQLPFRKVLLLAVVGAFLMSLAFASASLALSGLPIFIVLTAIWAFFPLSLYIFGDAEGLFGFMIFSSYFIATALVKSSVTTPGWVECVIFAYLIASILLVLKFFERDSYTRKMVAAGFLPQTHTNKMVSIRKNLAGMSLKKSFHDLLKDGVYLTGLRGYGKMVQLRLSGKTAEVFRGFMEESDAVSAQIADHIVNKRGEVDLQNLKSKFK
ncbi:MAG: FUSC family protein, partial [Methanobacterium paludis]|nr:FUSC family protein [Methanobacterium paludis]